MHISRVAKCALIAPLLSALSLAQADFYKCTQADGSSLYADSPCSSDAISSQRLSQAELEARTSNLGKLSPPSSNAHRYQPPTQTSPAFYQRISKNDLVKLQQLPPFFWAGLVILLLGWLSFLIAAFRISIWWGLGCLLLPFVSLFFLILHWRKAKIPFLLQLIGWLLLASGLL